MKAPIPVIARPTKRYRSVSRADVETLVRALILRLDLAQSPISTLRLHTGDSDGHTVDACYRGSNGRRGRHLRPRTFNLIERTDESGGDQQAT